MDRVSRLLLSTTFLLACSLLAGCITTTTGPQPPPESASEAAQLNLQLGIGYLRQDNLPAAQEKLEKAIEQDPRLAMAPAALGLVFERLQDLDGAERLYRRAASLDGRDPDVLNALAVFLCSTRGQPAEALRLFDRAIAIPLSVKQVNKAMLNTNAGTCARRLDLDRAEGYFRAALEQDRNWADALFNLADLANSRGNALQARAFVQRYLASGAVSPSILLLGYQVETALGDGAAAASHALRLRREFPQSDEARQLPSGRSAG